jgi:hypothetical protein
VSHRGAEHRHDPVADELVEPATIVLDLLAEARVIGAQAGPHIFRIGSVRSGSEPGKITKQHGHDPPLVGHRGSGVSQPGAASTAEGEPLRNVGAARGAGRHGR